MAKRKKSQNITVKEFKAWLSGIEEIHEVRDGKWVPDEKQWELVRKKINMIVEEPVEFIAPENNQPENMLTEPMPASSFAPPPAMIPPPQMSSIPEDNSNSDGIGGYVSEFE